MAFTFGVFRFQEGPHQLCFDNLPRLIHLQAVRACVPLFLKIGGDFLHTGALDGGEVELSANAKALVSEAFENLVSEPYCALRTTGSTLFPQRHSTLAC